jgi:hypothetical protein
MQVQAAKTLIRREVLRQVIAPTRVLASRMMLYYVDRAGFTRPWISVKNAIAELAEAGTIVAEDIDGTHWYRLPRVQEEKLDKARERNVPVFRAWTGALPPGAGHAEHLWRKAFALEGWVVADRPMIVECPSPDDGDAAHAEKHEIDVYATLPLEGHIIACEVRNGPGEGWVGPDVVRDWKLTRAQRNIRHHFSAMAQLGLTPMLAAPYVDPSFYYFQYQFEGVHARYLYHVFDPKDAEVAQSIRETFRIGHVWAESDPPNAFRAFVRRLPSIIEGPPQPELP